MSAFRMTGSRDTTVDRTPSGEPKEVTPRTEAFLVLLVECDRPFESSLRYSLRDLNEVTIGRAGERRAERNGGTLAIGLPDSRISKLHTRLTREFGRWVAQDAGSRNGTVIDDQVQQRALLEDGTILEIGHTLFLYREGEPCDLAEVCDAAAATLGGLTTFSAELRKSFTELARVAPTGVGILIQGESGSGKERVAHAVHDFADKGGDFVPVNCGALPTQLVESELFGFRKGAFSGAAEDRLGLIRSADRGTLFLDEIADLSATSQAALLRVLQEREVTPIGATRPIPVDVRIVAATHHDLQDQVRRGQFRHDLYARVAGYTLTLPPLRDRIEDLGLLSAALLGRGRAARYQARGFAVEAFRALLRHNWSLNVRELGQVLDVAAALAVDGRIEVAHLPPTIRDAPAPAAANLSDQERSHREQLLAVLHRNNGNVSAVARELGKARAQIQRWLKRYRLDPRDYRSNDPP